MASVGHLIAVKLLARSPQRLQDEVDLDALGRVASGADLDEARAAVRLITTRGFARDKHLEREFDEWRQHLGR